MTSSIPQPTYPGGGAFGTPPNYQPLNIGTPGSAFGAPGSGYFYGAGPNGIGSGILGGAQAQDLTAQSLMLKNFAQTYPTVNAAQSGFQGLLSPSNNLSNMFYGAVPGQLQNQENQVGNANYQQAEAWNQQNLANMVQGGLTGYVNQLTGKTGYGAMKQISNAAKGIYSNPNLQTAYNNFAGEASGNQPINPIVQQQMMQAGLTNAAQNLSPTSLGTGQTGEAQVATNFGQNAQQYIMNMQNAGLSGMQQLQSNVQGGAQNTLSALQSLTQQYLGAGQQSLTAGQDALAAGNQSNAISSGIIGENNAQQSQNMGLESLAAQMFPRTQIGLTGTDLANMMIANTQGQNQFNQNTWLAQMQAAQYNSSIQGANAGMASASSSGLAGAGIGAVASIAVVAFCWVARACLGERDPRWRQFRNWMLTRGPRKLRSIYLRKGEAFASLLSTRPALKKVVRAMILGILQTEKIRTFRLSLRVQEALAEAFYSLLALQP